MFKTKQDSTANGPMIERLGLKASLVKFLSTFADKMFSLLMIPHPSITFTYVYYPNVVID